MTTAPELDFRTFRQHTFVMLGICIAALVGIAVNFLLSRTLSFFGVVLFVMLLPSVKSIRLALGDEDRYRREFDPARFTLGQQLDTDRGSSMKVVSAWSPVTHVAIVLFFGSIAIFIGWMTLQEPYPIAILSALMAAFFALFSLRVLVSRIRSKRSRIIAGLLLAAAVGAWMLIR